MSSNTNSHCSPSASHITLVEKNMGLNANSGFSQDSLKTLDYSPSHAPKKLLIDRIVGLFCAKPSVNNEGVKTQTRKTPEVDDSLSSWQCPWILPVYVESNQQDAEKHSIMKIAKCTIDTGNLQGNIVSRDFVEKVLGFPSSTFEKLTKEEESGGTGITGEPHVPIGAIHLTWYHKNSTRVFRDMRFLVSPATQCDLIIGARSIQKDRILDVPCLLTRPSSVRDIILPNPPRNTVNPVLDKLNRIDYNIKNEWDESRNDRDECDQGTPKWNNLDKIYEKRSNEVDVVGWLIKVYGIAIAISLGQDPDTSEVTEMWDGINERLEDVRPEVWDKLEPQYDNLLKVKELGLKDGRGAIKA